MRCTSTPIPTSEHPVITISSSEISDTDRSSKGITYSPPSSENGSCYLPPEQFPDPPKIGDNAQKDLDEMDVSLDNFDLIEAMTRTSTRPNFLISKVPFMIMCMYIKRYLISLQVDPTRPQWPVPGMDKKPETAFLQKS